jgi:RNA polymerase primary sigma factor
LEKYLQEIGKVDLLTPEEEAEVAKKASQWDEIALERLTKANLRFVVSVAKQYQNQWLSLSDLINEWNIGLIKAARRHDETRWFKFISYAVRRIRQAILQALAEQARIVRLPLSKIWSLNKINKAHSELEQQYEREPTAEELAGFLEISTDEVEATLWAAWRHVSLDAPFVEWEDNSLLDVLSDANTGGDDGLRIQSLSSDVATALSTLTERQRDVIIHYFWLNGNTATSLEDIGDKYGLSKERTKQIKDRAINKLRKEYSSRILKTYL